MPAKSPMIAVIIPYFQRKPGLLTNAVNSVITQQVDAEILLIVVDDFSPAPADAELAGLPESWKTRTIVKRISNSGASHARNVGLDCVPQGVTCVAFLDSDDIWRPGHLERSLLALRDDGDFYFADFARHDWTTPAFARCPTFHPQEHHPLNGNQGLFRFRGDFFEQVLRNNPIGTSTVVYRFERFRALRFDEALTISGEDILFWLNIVHRNSAVVFSDRIECDYTAGVNICYDAKWGTEAGIEVSYNDLVMLDIVSAKFDLSSELKERLRDQRRRLSITLLEQIFHRVLRMKLASLRWLGKFFWHDWTSCIGSVLELSRRRAAKALGLQTS